MRVCVYWGVSKAGSTCIPIQCEEYSSMGHVRPARELMSLDLESPQKASKGRHVPAEVHSRRRRKASSSRGKARSRGRCVCAGLGSGSTQGKRETGRQPHPAWQETRAVCRKQGTWVPSALLRGLLELRVPGAHSGDVGRFYAGGGHMGFILQKDHPPKCRKLVRGDLK